MNKCYIITSYVEGSLAEIIFPDERDFIICADGGYEKAISYGFKPDIVIGDLDSTKVDLSSDAHSALIKHPTQKDESDTFLCVKYAVGRGFDEIIVAGGIGGRLDHTLSNLQTLAHFSDKSENISMVDEKNFVTMVDDSSMTIPRKEGWHLSIFSLSDSSFGVTTKGLLYPLRNATLSNTYPLGLSNDFCEDEASVEVKSGKLLVILSKD